MKHSSDTELPTGHTYGLPPLRHEQLAYKQKAQSGLAQLNENGVASQFPWVKLVRGLVVLTAVAGAFWLTIVHLDDIKGYFAPKPEPVTGAQNTSPLPIDTEKDTPEVIDSEQIKKDNVPESITNETQPLPATQKPAEVAPILTTYYVVVSSLKTQNAANSELLRVKQKYANAFLVVQGSNYRVVADSVISSKSLAQVSDDLKERYASFWLLRH